MVLRHWGAWLLCHRAPLHHSASACPLRSPAHPTLVRGLLRLLAPRCQVLLENSFLVLRSIWPSSKFAPPIFILPWGKSKHWSSPSFQVYPALLYFFLSRLNLPLHLSSSTWFSRSLYHPGPIIRPIFGILVGLELNPVLHINIAFSHCLITPRITWDFSTICMLFACINYYFPQFANVRSNFRVEL